MMVQPQDELRHVSESKLAKLAAIVDKTRSWSALIDSIARPLKMSAESIELIERQYYCSKSPTLALLRHWSITGRRRPTLGTLKQHLEACQLKWAEDYVKRKIMKQRALAQQPRPSASVSQDGLEKSVDDDEFKFEQLQGVLDNLQPGCPLFSFSAIVESTNKFCRKLIDSDARCGRCIGNGRFSSVFLAQSHHISKDPSEVVQLTVAAKLLKAHCNLDYLANEVNLARQIKHPHILELMGISLGGQELTADASRDCPPKYICLIYPFMQNGSLLECLDKGLRSGGHRHLTASQRVSIALKVAEGISYLHNFESGAIVHRDIKSANILIDDRCSPKLADFTLVRQLDSVRRADETHHSCNITGTSVYMPPEAFRGHISTKFDVFSFGICLLELLTGLKPFDEELAEDLLTRINDRLSEIEEKFAPGSEQEEKPRDKLLRAMLDQRAGEWHFATARRIFELALRATEVRQRDRPKVDEIRNALEDVYSDSSQRRESVFR